MPVDPFSGLPGHIQVYDSFDSPTLSSLWDTKSEVGSSAITIGSGVLRIRNPGTGTKGVSYQPTKRRFPRFLRISADIAIIDAHEAADGGHMEASLVLYKDASNYLKIGPYRDTSEGVNSSCYLRAKVAGVASNFDVSGVVCDTSAHVYSLLVTESQVLVYYDSTLYTSFEWANLVYYTVRLEAGTEVNSDICDVNFDYFDAFNNVDFVTMQIGTIVKRTLDYLIGYIGSEIVDEELVLSLGTTDYTFEMLSSYYGDAWDTWLTLGLQDFDDHAAAGTNLTVKVFRKDANGNYFTLPDFVATYTQGSLTVNHSSGLQPLRCYSDTKIVCRLASAPSANITIPIVGFVRVAAI
jgi:hypothetical protein